MEIQPVSLATSMRFREGLRLSFESTSWSIAGNQALELPVLVFESLEPAQLRGTEPAVLLPSVVEGDVANTHLAAQPQDRGAELGLL